MTFCQHCTRSIPSTMPGPFSLWFSFHIPLEQQTKLDFWRSLMRIWLGKIIKLTLHLRHRTEALLFISLAYFISILSFSHAKCVFFLKAYENFGEKMLLLQCRHGTSFPKLDNLVSIIIYFSLYTQVSYQTKSCQKYTWGNKAL